MKVQFIFTNFDCPVGPSMGVSYISSALKAAGHETKCLHISEWVDYPYDPDQILKDTLEYDPDIVAMCFGTNHAPEAKHIRKVLKEGGVRGKILCGGIHTTLNTEEIISDPNVDFANVGEGDDSAVDLANALRRFHQFPLGKPLDGLGRSVDRDGYEAPAYLGQGEHGHCPATA